MEFLRLFQRHWHYSRPEQWRVLFYLFWHSVSIIGSLSKPYAFAMALNSLQSGRLQEAGRWLAGYVAGFAVFELGHRVARSTERYLAFRNRRRFILSAYDRLHDLPLSWHNEHHSANVIDRINKAADALHQFGESQSNYIEVAVNLLGSLILLWTLSPWVAVVGCITGLLSIVVTKWLYKKSVPEYRAQNELFHKLAAALMDYISNITTIIVLRLGRRARNDLESRIDEIFPHVVKEHRITQVKCFFNALLVIALHVGMIMYYIRRQAVAGGVIQVGSVVAVFQYLGILMDGFGFYSFDYENVIHWWQDYQAASLIFQGGVLRSATGKTDQRRIPDDWRVLTTDAFEFSYGEGAAELRCGPIRLERGKRIAFVGESGAGKSTCLHILRGLYEGDGLLTLDEGARFPLRALGQITTLVGQNSEILENTILYNITLGVPTGWGEVEKAAQTACFDDVAKRLPQGYDSDVRENGVNLSGGEKQRLALARGVFAMKDSSLILLDEPTGSLDAATEETVYCRLFDSFPDACIVSTLHRLHLLPMFDEVYVFRDGEMVEKGMFAELIENGGQLSQLWSRYQLPENGM